MITNERGITLVEILVAVAIIGIGLVGLAVVVPVSTYGVQEGNQLSTATFLAEQRIEQARNAQWTVSPNVDCLGWSIGNAAPTIPGPCTSPAPLNDENPVAGFNGYSRTTRITQCSVTACAGILTNPPPPGVPPAPGQTTDMRLVTVTVTYTPISAAGGAPTPKTVTNQWIVAQR